MSYEIHNKRALFFSNRNLFLWVLKKNWSRDCNVFGRNIEQLLQYVQVFFKKKNLIVIILIYWFICYIIIIIVCICLVPAIIVLIDYFTY